MSVDNYRTICSIAGLSIGIIIMVVSGMSGLIPGFIFGAGGAVLGGIVGEKIHASKN